jgi:hypothetical protein
MVPLPLLSLLSPPTKSSMCVEEVLTSDRLPWQGKLLGILPSFHTGVLDSLLGQLENSSATLSIEQACDWNLDLPSSILCDCARAAEVLHFSSLKFHPNSDFCILCRFLSQTKHRACAMGSKKSGIQFIFETMVNR